MELDPDLYTVAWIAPLEIEARAALHILDKPHEGQFPWSHGYNYLFHAGDIHGHNVIIATLPEGEPYGTGSAAALASQIKTFFRNIKFGLLVGIAAGLPNLSRDIRLGDILVGLPNGESAGLIAYDLGKETKDGFQLLHSGHTLARTEPIIRSAIGRIKIESPDDTEIILPFYKTIQNKQHANGTFVDPGQDRDKLYEVGEDGVERTVTRERRPESKRTLIWYGPIGSGEKLIKNAKKRNELRDKYNIIGLEMEAAGIMNQIPVGVIRGVCDYGDEHKNKEWQPYAAAMAAAYAKAVLCEISPKILHGQSEKVQETGQPSQRKETDFPQDPAAEDDKYAFSILKNVILGRSFGIPDTVKLDTIINFLLLVDKYGLGDEPLDQARLWVRPLFPPIRKVFDGETITWLWILWKLDMNLEFKELSGTVLKHVQGPIDQGKNRPQVLLPQQIIDRLEAKRVFILHEIKNFIDSQIDSYKKEYLKTFSINTIGMDDVTKYELENENLAYSLLIGYMILEKERWLNLHEPSSTNEFENVSFSGVYQCVQSMYDLEEWTIQSVPIAGRWPFPLRFLTSVIPVVGVGLHAGGIGIGLSSEPKKTLVDFLTSLEMKDDWGIDL